MDHKEARVIERVSPTNGEIVSRVEAAGVDACESIVTRAAAAFPAWSEMPVADRAQILLKASQIILDRREEFRRAMIEEVAAPASWADHNVTFAAKILREVAKYSDDLLKVEVVPDDEGVDSRAYRVPCGVCLGLVPWNAPLILGVRSFAAPLLCGNTFVLKGNEFAPRTFQMLEAAMQDAGLPKGVLQVILTRLEDSEAAVEALIKSPVVRRVNYTGSTRIGRRVAEICASNLKRPLLELGGQASLIVLDDADLSAAAKAAASGAYLNQGQICMSTERVIVIDTVADELIGLIEKIRGALVLGDPADSKSDIGPVISQQAADRLSLLLSDAISKGARLIGGGKMSGAFVEPTLLDDVETDMRLYHEEVFGPLLSITRVASIEEAITVANDSAYGLSSAVFGKDQDRALSVAQRLHSGICHVNRTTVADNPHAPFGGVKSSGYGRFGGRWALNEFTELRWITVAP